MRNFILLTALAVNLLAQIPVANARDRHHGQGDALAAGLLGLGIGLAITAPRVYSRSYWHDDHEYYRYRRHHRPYQRHYYPRPNRPYYDDGYDYRRPDWND